MQRQTGRMRSARRTVLIGRWAALTLTLALAASGVGAPAAAAKDWNPAAPKDVAGVKVTDATARATAKPFSAESRAVRGPRKVTWPSAGSAVATLASGAVRAGTLPVTVSRATMAGGGSRSAAEQVGAVTVRVHDRATTDRAGIANGVLISLSRADGAVRDGAVAVKLDYSGFADAVGGDYASRLRLALRPACALTTPELPACQASTPLVTTNDTRTSTLTATVALSGSGATVMSTQAAPTGDNGDFTGTSLSPAGQWQVSTQTGDFSWSVPLRMPPSLGGPQPSINVAYSSGSIDGRTSTSNNQGSWIGDGWDSWPGFIERKYQSCADDNPGHKTGDQCWNSDNATLSMNGHSGELIKSGSYWHLKSDDGTRVEKLTDANRGNGDNDNEYWKVTTTDGMQYFFGYHKLPGWSSGKAVTDSTWTVPVYGNNSGEPCYNATFASAYCSQAWRWNLDYVVDPNANTMAYFYGKETGAYGRDNTPSQRTTYDRGGYLQRIEYGMRANAEYSQAAPLRVVLDTAERCLSGCWTGAAWTSDPTTSAWPDTPWDQYCKAAPCTDQGSPTFFSARRLTKVTTQTRNGTSTYADVESWALRQEFINAGTGEGTPMWLRGITRTGHVTTAGGSAVADPEITFDPGAEPLPNRVDGPDDGRSALNRWRIKAVHTESGGDIIVSYSGPDCTRTTLPTPETNTKRCMPSFYSPAGTPTLDWFHKYVVTRVDLDDVVTDQPTDTTFYDYLDAPAWAYNTDENTKDKYRTWGDWRGYGRVLVRHGEPTTGQQSAIEYRYLRGMDGDRLNTSGGAKDVWVTDSWNNPAVEDKSQLQGFLLQEITFNGPGGAEISSTTNEPWTSGPKATRTVNGVTTESWMVMTGATRTRTALSGGGYRFTKTMTAFNAEGLPVTADDLGDDLVPGDETCTRSSYARNDATGMIDKVSQVEKLSVKCADATAPAAPATVLSRARTFYDTYVDDTSFGAAPTKGNVVRTEELEKFNGSTPVYTRTATNTYDANGRLASVVDPRGFTTSTVYTTANGGLVTQTAITNGKNQTTTTLMEPAWGIQTRTTDPNGAVTDLTYDGLGRLTNVWIPGRAKATQTATKKFTYLVRNNGPSSVTTESLLPTGSAYKKSVELYDGWLRVRQQQTQATGGGRLIQETFYNTLGQKEWTSLPYYDSTNAAVSTSLGVPQGQIPSITRYTYDSAARVTAEILLGSGVEKWRKTTVYRGDRTDETPPAGGIASTSLLDVRGNTTELRQYKSYADMGSTDPAKFAATKYTYNLDGRLKTVTDWQNNLWSYDYDLRGRQIQAVDPDKGTTTTTYDAGGNIQTVTAPLGTSSAVTTAYTYDELSRKLTVRDDSVTGTIRASWLYDTLPGGIGHPTSSTRYAGGNAYTSRIDSYDAYGRITSSSVVLPAAEANLCASGGTDPCVYTTVSSYRANGAPYQITLPAAADLASEKLTMGYTDVGEVGTLLSASQIYVNTLTYDKLGELTQRQLGAFGSRVAVNTSYDEVTRRLTGASVLPELQAEAANYSYTYDNAGNINRISDAPTGGTADNQCYHYDYLRRVDEAWTTTAASCGGVPAAWSNVGGPDAYWSSWTFDATGNRKTETRHGAANTTYTYAYPTGTNPVRPHAVTNVTATGAASWSHDYTYDNAGNAKTRTTPAGTAQTLTYDREGKLESLVQGSTTHQYVYDVDGTRLIRIDGTGRTLYLPGGTEVRYTASGGAKTATRFYLHKDQVIAMRTSAGVSWIVGDHHNTAEITVNASTLAVAKRRSLPYGEQRGTTSGSWAAGMDKGFVGGTVDPTGLVHLGARLYDPFLGRFLSLDPIVDTSDPQQMQGYVYSNNSPVSFSDPAGTRLAPDDGGGGSAATVDDKYNEAKRRYFKLGSNPTGSLRVSLGGYNLPDRIAPGNGIIVMRCFIPEKEVTGGFGLAGDGREWSTDPDAGFRVSIAWNTDTGEVNYEVTQSCNTDGECAAQNWTDDVVAEMNKDGNVYNFEYGAKNSMRPGPAVNGVVGISFSKDGTTNVSMDRDDFPNMEVIQYRQGQDPRFLAQSGYSGRGALDGPIAMFPFVANRVEQFKDGEQVCCYSIFDDIDMS